MGFSRMQAHREIADQVRMILGALGVYLLLFGLAATVWSVRAAVGQNQYAELLMHPCDAEAELRLARRAFLAYPRNYAICIRAADTAFKAAEAAPDSETAGRLWGEADYWVGRGMDLNPHLMELHYLKARLLARQDAVAAAEAWKVYVDWHFWDPNNLEILARFQEAAGRDQDALQTLQVLKPWSAYEAWRVRIEARMGTNGAGFIQSAPREPARP